MKLTEIINEAKETLFSIEILPPLKGKDIKSLYNGIDPLIEFKPAFIDVTYHREEFILRKRKDGGFDKVFTTGTGSDLCITEIAAQLSSRIEQKSGTPLYISACPAWVTHGLC